MENDSKNKSTCSRKRRTLRKIPKSQVKTKKMKTPTTEKKTQEANHTEGRKTEKVHSKFRHVINLRKKAKSTTKQQQKHNDQETSFRFDDVQVALISILDEPKTVKSDKENNEKLVVLLQNCFNKCLKRNSYFVQILQEEQSNFHFSTALKILILAVLRRLTLRSDGIFLQDKYQSGFNTHEHIHTLCQLQEKCNLHQISLCFCFVELQRRDIPTNIQPLLDNLVRNESDKKFASLLKNIHTYLLYSHADEKQKQWLLKRVATIYHNSQLAMLLDRNPGFELNGKNLTHLLYGNHIVLIAEFPEHLMEIIIALKKFHPKTKFSQMKVMLGNRCKKFNFVPSGVKIPVVEKYTYHGKVLSASGSYLPDMKRRIEDAWNAFDEELISQAQTEKEMKSVLQKKIIPILVEGTQMSSVTESEIKELNKVVSQMEEEMLDCATGHVLPSLAHEILKLKLRWAGHVMRREETRWCRHVTSWPPSPKQNSPPKMIEWRNELIQLLGPDWSRFCSNRSLWRETCEKLLRNSAQSGGVTPDVRHHNRSKTVKSNSSVTRSQSRVIKAKANSTSTSYRSSHHSSLDYNCCTWSLLGIYILLYYLKSQNALPLVSTSNVFRKLFEFTFSKRVAFGLSGVMFLRYLF